MLRTFFIYGFQAPDSSKTVVSRLWRYAGCRDLQQFISICQGQGTLAVLQKCILVKCVQPPEKPYSAPLCLAEKVVKYKRTVSCNKQVQHRKARNPGRAAVTFPRAFSKKRGEFRKCSLEHPEQSEYNRHSKALLRRDRPPV